MTTTMMTMRMMTITSILLITTTRESNLLLDQPCWLLVINLVTLDQLHRWFIIIILLIIIKHIIIIIIINQNLITFTQIATICAWTCLDPASWNLQTKVVFSPSKEKNEKHWKDQDVIFTLKSWKAWQHWKVLKFRPRLSLPADRESQTVDRYNRQFVCLSYWSKDLSACIANCQFVCVSYLSNCLPVFLSTSLCPGEERREGQTASTTRDCRWSVAIFVVIVVLPLLTQQLSLFLHICFENISTTQDCR